MSARAQGWGAALAAAVACAACGDVAVLQGVPEVEANRAVAALDRAGVASRKGADEGASGGTTFRVSVDADDVSRAVAVLHAHALPRREQAGFRETYGATSLVQGASEERARAAQAIAGELARTIETIDGVLDARVHVSLAEARDAPLDGAPAPRSSASVLVRYAGAGAPYDEGAIRRLVAGAVAGMRAEDVAVVGMARVTPRDVTEARLAWVGPIAVARGSAGRLRALLAGSLGANVALAAGLLWVMRARRRRDDAGGGGERATKA